MEIIDHIISTFQQTYGHAPAHIARAPGRVNLLGEHVDYNDGFVLPAAIDRATYVAFSPADADQTRLVAADFDQEAFFSPRTIPLKTQTDGSPLPEWAQYPAGVMWALNENRLEASGLNAVYASNVPRGSGLSSSASVEMAFVIAWQALGGWTLPSMQRALLGQKAENQYVGVNCGIMISSLGLWCENRLPARCRSLE
jgi:galactokinase